MHRIWFSICTALLCACGADCVEGATSPCTCMGGLAGVQACTADGTLGQCDCGQLTNEEARRLVTSLPEYSRGVLCEAQVQRFAHSRYAMEFSDRVCIRALAAAGLVREGGCVDDYGGCSRIEVTPQGSASVDSIYLGFPCGTAAFVGITGITTEGAQATISYERDVTLNQQLVSSLSVCRMNVPTAGRVTRERRARRDDNGRWSLVNARR